MDITTHYTTNFKKLLALLTFCVLAINNSNAQNLLFNGDFENGGSGNGFQTQSPYNYLATLTGNSVPGDYAIISDAQLMNTAWFIHCKDHSGTGKMFVVDGINIGGQQRFWKAGNSGGGVGPLTVGTTYTFSYWVRSVSKSATDIFTTADIGIQFNNASSVTLTAGSTLLPFDTATGWVQVKYTFVPTNAYVNIEMYNNNTSSVGNDFAIDDIAVTAPPLPLAVSYSLNNPTCYNNADGYIIAYGSGGTAPYTYSFDGGAFSATNTLKGLATSSHTVSVKDALLNTVSSSTINITAPSNPLTATANVNPICAGNNTTLTAANGGASYNWTASPVDASLTTPGIYNPVVSPAAATTYIVTSSTTSNVNLIYNGNFSLGNTGFTTDYTYKTVNTGGAQKSYGVMPNAQVFFNTFSTCGDHTTGTENMYVVDGSLNSADKVWCQTVVVKPSTTYTFSYWIQTLTINNPAQIETKINGVTVPAGTSANPVNAPATIVCGNWQQVSYSWTSGAGVTTAEICLYDKNVNANGNDFALDDISFTGSYGCNLSKTVTVAVNPPATNNNINLFDCNSVTYHGNTYTNNTIVRDTLKTVQGCDSVYNVANISVGMRTPFAYITNIISSNISVIKTETNTVVATIPVVGNPIGIGVSPDGKIVYVSTNSSSNNINIINTATNSITTSFSVGAQPAKICVSLDGKKLYIANTSTNTVNVINTNTNTSIASIPVGIQPQGMALTPDGTKLFVTNTVGNSISIVNTLTNSVITNINAGAGPTDICMSPDGTRVYVSNFNSNSISVINAITNSVLATITGVGSPKGISVNPNGTEVYFGHSLGGISRISIINPLNNTITGSILLPTSSQFEGISFTPDGKYAYVNNGSIGGVSVIDCITKSIITTVTVGSYPASIGNFIANVPRSATSNTTNLTSCKSITYKGNTYTTSTVLKDTLHSIMGCDSIYNTVNISINPITPTTKNTSVSGCDSVIYKTITYKVSTVLKDTVKSYQGCDSIYNIANITVKKTTSSTTTINTISPYTWNGTTYTTNGTYIKTGLINSVGCDSSATLVLTISSITTNPCWKMISTGANHTVAIKKDGTLWAWGQNTYGQVGDGTNTHRNTPTQIGTDTNWESISAKGFHTVAIKTNGTLWAWGQNSFGQVGDGTSINRNVPVQVGTATNWSSISSGISFTLALKKDSTLWAWGYNILGQLGDGTLINKNTPTQIGTYNKWVNIGTGEFHSAAIKVDGTLWTWGSNSNGQLGDGTTVSKNTPTQIGTDNNWSSFKGGNAHTIALKTDNTLWTWGGNLNGQLGDGTNISKNIPTQLGAANNWRAINAGGGFSMALTTAGTIWACGKNTNGQLGNGTNVNNNTLTKIGVDINWVSINAGDNHFIASKTDGSLWACGYNLYGQLGDGTNADKNLPKLVISGCSPCPVATTQTQTFTNCKAIVYNGNTYNTSTILKDTIKNLQGCDSIFNIVNINISPITTITNTDTASGCGSVVYKSITYTASTVLKDTIRTLQGCDSIYNIATITVHPAIATPTASVTQQPTCNDPNGIIVITNPIGTNYFYSIDGVNYQSSANFNSLTPATYFVTVKDTNTNCISSSLKLVVDTIHNVPTPIGYVSLQPTCSNALGTFVISSPHSNNYAYFINGSALAYVDTIYPSSISGIYSIVATDLNTGCISDTLNLILNPYLPVTPTNNIINLVGCNSVIYNGTTYTTKAILKDTVKSLQGCDSIYNIVNININPITTTTNIQTISSCKSIVYNGNTYSVSTVVKDTIKSLQGCDSVYNIVSININLITATTNTQTIPSCKSVVYNGNIYSASTILKDTVKSLQGCDSVYNTVNININPITATTNTQTISSCKSIVYNGNNYAVSTVVKDTVKSKQGCDSVYNTVNININPITTTTNTETISSCKSIVYNGNTYPSSAVIHDTIKSLKGCDSVYNIVNINIKPIVAITKTSNFTGCGSVNYNSVLYTTSISYFDTIRSLQGCDSVYNTTNIIVYPLPTVIAGSDLYVMPNSSVVLNPIITNATTVNFTPANYLDDATSEHPICTPLSDQNYLIKATSIDGCTDTSSLKIFIVKPINVPNVFSPNGDGINDTWDIEHITDYPFATISIFNRQGQLLKSSKTKSIKVWDGTYNGQQVPVAAYYWIIKLTPNSEPMSGIVTVLR